MCEQSVTSRTNRAIAGWVLVSWRQMSPRTRADRLRGLQGAQRPFLDCSRRLMIPGQLQGRARPSSRPQHPPHRVRSAGKTAYELIRELKHRLARNAPPEVAALWQGSPQSCITRADRRVASASRGGAPLWPPGARFSGRFAARFARHRLKPRRILVRRK